MFVCSAVRPSGREGSRGGWGGRRAARFRSSSWPRLLGPGVLAEFAAAIREGREPEASGRDNLLILELVFAAVEAAASGGAERL
jgi:predicted dehydrogenase